jgi:Reverse transcriptase (RNA-dependent DNA polymerase)
MVYHQVTLEEDSKKYTAFTYEEDHFQFKVIIFGFMNVPLIFQIMMSNYLQDMTGKFVEVYLDDILIYSEC